MTARAARMRTKKRRRRGACILGQSMDSGIAHPFSATFLLSQFVHTLAKSHLPDEVNDGPGEAQLFRHHNPRVPHGPEAKSSVHALMNSLGILQAFLYCRFPNISDTS